MPSTFIARGGLEIVREIGVERLHERTIDLGALAIRLADAAGLRVRAVRDDARRGGIVGVEVAEPKPVVDGLAERGIIVDYRPGIVRLSPAFYNTEDEVRPSSMPSPSWCPSEIGSDCNGIGATPSLMGDTTHRRTDADRGDPPGP